MNVELLRRATLFSAVFGGLLAFVAWQAGGIRGTTTRSTGSGVRRPAAGSGTVIPLTPDAGLGQGRGVRIARDAVAVVDGEPITYRLYEAAWATQQPLPGGGPDERRLHTEQTAILIFHRRPTALEPSPPAVEGPDTTRIDADAADVEMTDRDDLSADLTGHVVVTRHEREEDLVLRTESLRCVLQGTDVQRASSEERVTIEGRAVSVAGTGLEADFRTEQGALEATLARDVRGTFLTRPGALTSEGGVGNAAPVEVTVTCDGQADVESAPRGGGRHRWIARFRENVVVEQSGTVTKCAFLEVEFVTAGERREATDEPIELIRMVADGGVAIDGRGGPEDTYAIRARRAVTARSMDGGYETTLDGGTRMTFVGTLTGDRGRLEVTSDGPTTLTTDARPVRGDALQGAAHFRENVVVRQWGAIPGPDGGGEELQTEVRAPQISLLGNRAGGGSRFTPEWLTATGDEKQRVHVRRKGLESQSHTLTWSARSDDGRERLLLTGRPVVTLEDHAGMNPFGAARAAEDGRLLITAQDEIDIRLLQPAEGEDIDPEAPAATVHARGGVLVQRLVGEREAYRLSAGQVDVHTDAERNPRLMRAYGSVVAGGRGEREGDRPAELRGERLTAVRAAGEAGEDWTRTSVIVLGDTRGPAVASIEEQPSADGGPRSHEISAQELHYEDEGTRILARRGARAAVSSNAAAAGSQDLVIEAVEITADVRPPADPAERRSVANLLRVTADGSVRMTSGPHVVTGDVVTYDHVAGTAVAQGEPARAVQSHPDSELENLVISETIRVEFDTTTEPRRPMRLSCQGGRIVRHDVPEPGSREGGVTRVTITADGPIEVLESSGSAERNVVIVYDAPVPGSAWRERGRIEAERADLEFDSEAQGELRDRLTHALAVGGPERPARLTSPTRITEADQVDIRGDWADLSSPRGRRIQVTERDTGREYDADSARWNHRTDEMKAVRIRVR